MILRRLTSLRARLLLGVIAGMIVLQVATGIGVYLLQRRALYGRFDQAVASTAKALVPLLKYNKPAGLHLEVEGSAMPEFQRAKGPDYFQIWRADGSVVARSQTLGDADLPTVPATLKPAKYDCVLPRGEPGRCVMLTVELPREGFPGVPGSLEKVTLVVAKETKPVRGDLRALAWILLGTSLAGAIVAGGLALAVVSHGLRPLNRVARQIADLQPSGLGSRIDAAGLPNEMQPVAQRLNELLGRLQVAFERERGFTADIAHEFRNPLAGIRSIGEVALSSPQASDEYRQDISEIVSLATTMQTIVEKLLLLARLEAGQISPDRTQVDLGGLVTAAIADLEPRLNSRGVSMSCNIAERLGVSADHGLLTLVVRNVLDNAAEYVDDGGRVVVQGEHDGNMVTLTVSNTGCHLAPDAVTHVFDRFWRADSSRSATMTHVGLGLSLVQRAMAVLGGGAEAGVEGNCFTLRVRLRS
jgi:signal transduction histidine kinase